MLAIKAVLLVAVEIPITNIGFHGTPKQLEMRPTATGFGAVFVYISIAFRFLLVYVPPFKVAVV